MKKNIVLPRKVLRKCVLYTASYYCYNPWPKNENEVWNFFQKGLRKFYSDFYNKNNKDVRQQLSKTDIGTMEREY